MTETTPPAEMRHQHNLFKFNCLVEGHVPYRTLYICFGCGRAFTQKVEYKEVGVKLQ